MKIRTDFVTNSSSSSFTVLVSLKNYSGEKVKFYEDPGEYSFDVGGRCCFDSDLKELLFGDYLAQNNSSVEKSRLVVSSISELAKLLMDNVSDDYEYRCYDKDEEEEGFDALIAQRKEEFINEAVEKIKSLDDISSITVKREYYANGEYMDLLADNDAELCELAKRVVDGDKTAIEEIRKYVKEPHKSDSYSGFGYGFELYYGLDDDEASIISLSERLCSDYGPDSTEGYEIMEIDLQRGKYKKYAEFYLT